MFVSVLIENDKYFNYSKYVLIITLALSFLGPIVVSITMYETRWIVYPIVAIFYIALMFYQGKIQK